jgi:hypothetical protein
MLALRILTIVFPVFAIGHPYGRIKRPHIGAINQISMDGLVLNLPTFDGQSTSHCHPIGQSGLTH